MNKKKNRRRCVNLSLEGLGFAMLGPERRDARRHRPISNSTLLYVEYVGKQCLGSFWISGGAERGTRLPGFEKRIYKLCESVSSLSMIWCSFTSFFFCILCLIVDENAFYSCSRIMHTLHTAYSEYFETKRWGCFQDAERSLRLRSVTNQTSYMYFEDCTRTILDLQVLVYSASDS